MHIILASASPRRRELIRRIGWEEEIEKSHFMEVKNEKEALAWIKKEKKDDLFHPFSQEELVCIVNAYGKARDAVSRRGDDRPVLGADTIVVLGSSVLGSSVLGKPKDQEDAFRMLSCLSGRVHQVKTGMALLYRGKTDLSVTTTEVRFRQLDKEEIMEYIATGEPADKAGAYGIQGLGTLLVESICGSYDNVVGLPLAVLYERMRRLVNRREASEISR